MERRFKEELKVLKRLETFIGYWKWLIQSPPRIIYPLRWNSCFVSSVMRSAESCWMWHPTAFRQHVTDYPLCLCLLLFLPHFTWSYAHALRVPMKTTKENFSFSSRRCVQTEVWKERTFRFHKTCVLAAIQSQVNNIHIIISYFKPIILMKNR